MSPEAPREGDHLPAELMARLLSGRGRDATEAPGRSSVTTARPPARINAEDQTAITLTLLRVVHGWNQDDLAKASGVGNSAISDYERGRKHPALATLLRLLEAMDYSIAAVEITHRYIETLHALGSARSAPTPAHMAAPEPHSSEALCWEIQQVAADLTSILGRVVKLGFHLLPRRAKGETQAPPLARGRRRLRGRAPHRSVHALKGVASDQRPGEGHGGLPIIPDEHETVRTKGRAPVAKDQDANGLGTA